MAASPGPGTLTKNEQNEEKKGIQTESKGVDDATVLAADPDGDPKDDEYDDVAEVDVDRSGRPCKERQSTVLARRPLADRPPLEGFEEEEYADTDGALDAALERLGVLHCGVGAQRFGVR